ncbi:MAG TPA: hypothetical protein VF384_16355 [Planctomycetota bacterium]
MRTTLLLSFLLANAIPAQGDLLYSVCTTDGILRRVNPLTGVTASSVQMVTTAAVNVMSCTGLAHDPITGQLYAILRVTGSQTTRRLATVDPATGVVSVIGAFTDNFSSLAFRFDGVLFAVTGDGATVPESLYTVDVNTASATFVMSLGQGSDGEAIAFGADGYLYHLSGYGVPNVDEIFERIDTLTNVVTPVPLSGYNYDEVHSVTLWVGGNLLLSDINDHRVVLNTGGVSRLLGSWVNGPVKGLAFVPAPSTQPFFRPYGVACAAAAGAVPLLTGSGVPSPGLTVQLDLVLAPFSVGVIGLGASNVGVPIPSPECQIQILPLWSPELFAFATSAAGTWTLPLFLPAGLPPDLYFQVALIDAGGPGGLIVSNPLQMHIL